MAPMNDPPGDDERIHVIQSRYDYRDADGRPVTSITLERDEGWFTDEATANARRDRLNHNDFALYEIAMARARREREAKIAAAEATNREHEILRAHGIDKRDVKVPEPFQPIPYEDYVPEHGRTRYEVVRLTRSEHEALVGTTT